MIVLVWATLYSRQGSKEVPKQPINHCSDTVKSFYPLLKLLATYHILLGIFGKPYDPPIAPYSPLWPQKSLVDF